MSAIPPGAVFNSEVALFRPMRQIGGFVADITIVEEHRDQLTITQHPVENGAAITDHAFKNPPQVTIEAGWADDPAGLAELYRKLVELQDTRNPTTVYTGKRIYSNMLVAQIHTHTDNKTANVLVVRFVLQNIILVSTQKFTVAAGASANSGQHSEPQATAAPQNQGQQSLQPAMSWNTAGDPQVVGP